MSVTSKRPTQIDLSPESDTYVAEASWGGGAETTNYDTSTELSFADGWDQDVSYFRAILMTFDLRQFVGRKIGSATLKLYRVNDGNNAGGVSFWIAVRRILRAYVASEVTWTRWSVGNNWTTGGARGIGSDIHDELYAMTYHPAANSYDTWFYFDITTLAQMALDAGESKLRIAIASWGQTQGQNPMTFASKENSTAANRPKLTVSY